MLFTIIMCMEITVTTDQAIIRQTLLTEAWAVSQKFDHDFQWSVGRESQQNIKECCSNMCLRNLYYRLSMKAFHTRHVLYHGHNVSMNWRQCLINLYPQEAIAQPNQRITEEYNQHYFTLLCRWSTAKSYSNCSMFYSTMISYQYVFS